METGAKLNGKLDLFVICLGELLRYISSSPGRDLHGILRKKKNKQIEERRVFSE